MKKEYGFIIKVDRDENESYICITTSLKSDPPRVLERIVGRDAMILISSIFDTGRDFITLKGQYEIRYYSIIFETQDDLIKIYRHITRHQRGFVPIKVMKGGALRTIFYDRNVKTIL